MHIILLQLGSLSRQASCERTKFTKKQNFVLVSCGLRNLEKKYFLTSKGRKAKELGAFP